MKRILLLQIVGVLGLCGLLGCSKSKPTGSQANPATNSAAISSPTNSPADPLEVSIKWQPGKKYFWQMEIMQSWESSGNPQSPGKITLGLTHDYTLTVLKTLPDGGRELEMEFTAQKMFYQMGEVPLLNFDSAQDRAQDANNPVAPVLRRLLGVRLHLTADARGKMTKVVGFDQLRAQLAGAQPQVRSMIEGLFNEENLQQLCSFPADLQPDVPVKIGDTWPAHMEMPDPVGLMVMDLKCTLKDWEPQGDRSCVRVDFQGDISSKPPANGRPAATKIDGGTISGKAWLDPQLGMLINSATEQHMTMSMAARGATVTTQFNLSINFRLIKTADSEK